MVRTLQVRLAATEPQYPTWWPLVVHRNVHSFSNDRYGTTSSNMAVTNPFGIAAARPRSRSRSRSISTVPDSEPDRQDFYRAQQERRQRKKREKSQLVADVLDDGPVPSSSKVTLHQIQPPVSANDIITIDESESEEVKPQVHVDLSRFKYDPSTLKVPTSRANLSASTSRAASALPPVGAIRQYIKKGKGKGKAVELPPCPIDEKLIKELRSCVVCGEDWPPRKMVKTKWNHMFTCHIDNYPTSIDHVSDLTDLIASALKKLIAADNGELSGRATILEQFANDGTGRTEIIGSNGELLGHSLTTADDSGPKKNKKKTRKGLAGLPRDVRVLAVDAEARDVLGGISEEVRGRLKTLWSDETEASTGVEYNQRQVESRASSDDGEETDFRPPATQVFGRSALVSRLGESRVGSGKTSMFHAESAFTLPDLGDHSEGGPPIGVLHEVDRNLVVNGLGDQPFRGRGDDDAGSSLRPDSPQQRSYKRFKISEDDVFGPSCPNDRI